MSTGTTAYSKSPSEDPAATMANQPAGTTTRARKSHTKSRHGCANCKARRVKCDEQRPSCSTCVKRRESCRYPGAQWQSPSRTLGSPEFQRDHIDGARHRRELELLHHWSTSTHLTVASELLNMDVSIPRLAFDHDYLLHTLFSLTSLHLAFLYPEDAAERMRDAADYQVSASTACRRSLNNLSPADIVAMFHCSALLGMLALAFYSVERGRGGRSHLKPSDTVLQLSQLWRGTTSVLIAAKSMVDHTTFQMLFPDLEDPNDNSPLAQADERQLIEKLRMKAEVQPYREAYMGAIEILQSSFRSSKSSSAAAGILGWMPRVSPAFMELFAQRDPMASAITIAYAVLLREFENVWWVGPFGLDLIDEMTPIIAGDPQWSDIVQWAGRRG